MSYCAHRAVLAALRDHPAVVVRRPSGPRLRHLDSPDHRFLPAAVDHALVRVVLGVGLGPPRNGNRMVLRDPGIPARPGVARGRPPGADGALAITTLLG